MRKFLIVLIVIATTLSVDAKVWRVNNNPGVSANFTDVQPAHDAAANGDTIMVEPSATKYGSIVLTKRLVLLGAGYFLNEYPGTQAYSYNSVIGGVTFDDAYTPTNTLISTSAGSVMSGLEVSPGGAQITVSNITISRCYFANSHVLISFGYNTNGRISISNITITQNFVSNGGIRIDTYPPQTTVSNVLIRNNIIRGGIVAYEGSNCIIQNNTFIHASDFYLHNSTFQDNLIFTHPQVPKASFSGANSSVLNNVFSSTYGTGGGFGPGNNFNFSNNIASVNIQNVFATDPNPSNPPTGFTSDNRYRLKSGSPASGAASNGGDVGAFAGGSAYVLAGIPAIPTIYEYVVPASGQNSLNVKMSIRSNP